MGGKDRRYPFFLGRCSHRPGRFLPVLTGHFMEGPPPKPGRALATIQLLIDFSLKRGLPNWFLHSGGKTCAYDSAACPLARHTFGECGRTNAPVTPALRGFADGVQGVTPWTPEAILVPLDAPYGFAMPDAAAEGTEPGGGTFKGGGAPGIIQQRMGKR